MDDPNADPDKLAIRCPGCGQRFMVGLELRDRMVECGTCEHRFRVNDEVVVRTKKFYPGERRGKTLDTFSRVPKTMGTSSANFQTVQYSAEPVHPAVETGSPLRLIFGFIAVTVALLIALMLIFGGSAGGMLYGTSQSKRLMLAGFTALVTGALLIAANPRARGAAVLGAVLSAAALLGLPFIFTDGVTTAPPVVIAGDPENPGKVKVEEVPTADGDLERLKEEIAYAPLERAIGASKGNTGNAGRGVAGIWLRGLQEYHKLGVKDYIVRKTGADPGESHMYPRPESRSYLMVVSGVTDDLAELSRLCERFGEVKRIIEPLRVIEIVVDNNSFLEGPVEKLTDPGNPAFYELNRRELDSIDLERARRAVVRLAPAEPKLYRKDIVRRMQELLVEGDVPLQGDVGKALITWSEPGDGSEEAARTALQKISAGQEDVPESLVKFLVARKDVAVIPLVDEFWARDATQWEELYSGLGQPIEDKVLARYGNATVTLKMSAARLLAKIGTAKSLPMLEASRGTANPELRVFIDRALAAIKARG